MEIYNIIVNNKEDINVTASANTNKTEQDSKSSSGSLGVTIGTGGLQGVNAGYSQSKGEIKGNGSSYNESTVTANKDLTFTSGEDTNIKGGMLSGEKVTGNVGGDLNIESKQDSNSYKEKNTSAGLNLDLNLNNGKIGVSGGASKENIDSNYNSVTDQSGIYAGEEGFDITVGNNTDLKGGIIGSEATSDKNKISTGTLTYEDVDNKAEYEAGSIGANVNINNGADYNEKGITPAIGMPAEGKEESTTKSTIAAGEIEIRDKENQKQDLAGLNRDTQNSLNKLGEIFDKDSIKEKQELAGLFGELAYNQIHNIDGTPEQKAALHALVGGIMGELTGSGFLAGASGAAVNKLLSDELKKIAGDDPALHQWLSAALGAVVSDVVAGNAQAGSSAAASGTKNNDLDQELATGLGHLPKTETEVADGKEQNLNNPYELTFDDVKNAILGSASNATGNKAFETMLSKEFPDYVRIESYPGSNNVFKVYYKSGGKMVSSVLKKVPVASGGSLLIKLSTAYENGDNVDWNKEISKFVVSEGAGTGTAGMIAGPAGIVVGVVVGGVVEASFNNMWNKIESFKNGGVPLD